MECFKETIDKKHYPFQSQDFFSKGHYCEWTGILLSI